MQKLEEPTKVPYNWDGEERSVKYMGFTSFYFYVKVSEKLRSLNSRFYINS